MSFKSLSSETSRLAIDEQWERFQRNEAVDTTVVRPIILRSWINSRQFGAEPRLARPTLVPSAEYKKIKQSYADLVEAAIPIMDSAFSMLAHAESVMLLSNEQGVVLRVLPVETPQIRESMIDNECYVGTAGIPLCIKEKETVQVFTSEHYCKSYQHFVDTAAPIYNKENKMIGVLSFGLDYRAYHMHTLGINQIAADAISDQIRMRTLLQEQYSIMELFDDGILLLDNELKLITTNRKVVQIFGNIGGHLGKNFAELCKLERRILLRLKQGENFSNLETILIKKDGTEFPCTLTSNSASETTRLLTIRELKKMRAFVTETIGAQASYTFKDIIGESNQLKSVVNLARKIAPSDVTVLLLGESGTGKEIFAHAIHNASPRAGKPFVVVNCGALPHELVQTELFGYDEGAYTGASRSGKPGKFELADEGTIFLDEIGEMPQDAQANLLRVLQNGEISRIGSKRNRQVNVRVIAATNRNLAEQVACGAFRQDLYYRLNVVSIFLPPLRERPEDLELLVHFFIHKLSSIKGLPVKAISGQALSVLRGHTWPGNIRELENIIERASYLCSSDVINIADLPSQFQTETAPPAFNEKENGATGEKNTLCAALRQSRGSVIGAAQLLGLSRSTLYYKLNKFALDPATFRNGHRLVLHPEAAPSFTASHPEFTQEQLAALKRLLDEYLIK